MANQEQIRIGVISFAHGHIHRYLSEISNFPDAKVVAAWDTDQRAVLRIRPNIKLNGNLTLTCYWLAQILMLSLSPVRPTNMPNIVS
jgi:hypothetical protein